MADRLGLRDRLTKIRLTKIRLTKIRLTKIRLFTIAVVGISLTLCLFLGWTYLQHYEKQALLHSEIDLFERVLGKELEGDEAIEARLAEAQAELAAVQAAFAIEVSSTEILDTVLEAAAQSSVQVNSVTVQGTRTMKIGESTYTLYPFYLRVQGSYTQLLAFLDRLEQGVVETLVLERVSLNEAGDGSFVANLNFSVYSQALSAPTGGSQ